MSKNTGACYEIANRRHDTHLSPYDSTSACSRRRIICSLAPERITMTCMHFAHGQVLFREGDQADGVFRLLSGTVDIVRELDGDPILLGTVGAGQFVGEMGVMENRPRSATARAASEVEVEFLTS